MRYGLSIPNFAEPGPLVDIAREADARGWDGFFLWDHIVVGRDDPPPISEPWTVLAAVALVTTRCRIGTLVTPVARRRPWVLARQVTTVDHLSGGRAVLGVGLGVPPDLEYGAVGEPSDSGTHAARLDDGLTVIERSWSGEPVQHRGPAFCVDGVRFLPRPIQRPRVPVWCAAALPARAGLRRAARWDGVAPIHSIPDGVRPLEPDEVAEAVDEIRSRRPAGSMPGFEVVIWALDPDREQRRRYQDAGATWLIEGPAPGPDWLDDAMGIARSGPPGQR